MLKGLRELHREAKECESLMVGGYGASDPVVGILNVVMMLCVLALLILGGGLLIAVAL